MRPTVRFLTDDLIDRIIAEARDVLCRLGVEINNSSVVELLGDHGAGVDTAGHRVFFAPDIIDRSLKSVPNSFRLYDSLQREAVDLAGDNVNFTPGSAAINLLDSDGKTCRRPTTSDYVHYTKLVDGMEHIASQATALIPADVPETISDSYRL